MSEETAEPETMTSNCAARRNSSGAAGFDSMAGVLRTMERAC
jgi:hypothetical protein